MNRQYFSAIATAAILLAVSAFAFSATDFGSASEPTPSVAEFELLAPSPVAAVVPVRGTIDLNDWQPTDFRSQLQDLFASVADLYRQYPAQSFLFFRFVFHKTPFAG